MSVALPRKLDTILPRAAERTLPRTNLVRVEPNRSGSLSRGKGISVCCALSVETVLWRCFFQSKMENEQCLALIQLYTSKAVLWNSKSANYRNKSVHEDAWKDIGDELKMSVQDLKNMTSLLASYRREKSRIKKSHINGPGTNIFIKLLLVLSVIMIFAYNFLLYHPLIQMSYLA
jgi:hypothetical protein